MVKTLETLGTPAEAYAKYMVPAIFAAWTPSFVAGVAPRRRERALDVACGTGVVTRAVAPRVGPEGSVTGLDVSQPMLDVARGTAPPEGSGTVARVQADATDMPLPDDDVDVVLCQQGLQFFPDRAAGRDVARAAWVRTEALGGALSRPPTGGHARHRRQRLPPNATRDRLPPWPGRSERQRSSVEDGGALGRVRGGRTVEAGA